MTSSNLLSFTKLIAGAAPIFSWNKLFNLNPLSFEKWLTIHNQVSNKLNLTEEGLSHVRTLQKQINLNNSMTNKTGKA